MTIDLSIFSKVFERIVFDSVSTKHLDKFHILDGSQHGFRSGRSKSTGTIQLIEYVQHGLDEGFLVPGLFFDLSRSFESLSFKFIIEKSYNLGFTGVFLEWLLRFLEGRTKSVEIPNCFPVEHKSLHVCLRVPFSVHSCSYFLFVSYF